MTKNFDLLEIVVYHFISSIMALILCKSNVFDIFDTFDFWQFFVISRSTEIPIESNF